MDTSLPGNALFIDKIKQRALNSRLFEAFLESAPQLILQCSIILRTGYTSNYGQTKYTLKEDNCNLQ
jgi:hypothetical protein